MEEALKELLQMYENKLNSLIEEGHDECYDCCDFTALGEIETCYQEFIKDLKKVLE